MPFADILSGAGAGLGGLISLLGGSGRDGQREREQATQVFRDIPLPELNASPIAAPQFRDVALRSPEQYAAHLQGGPQQITEGPEGRAAQVQSLQRLSELARDGLPLQERLAVEDINRGIGKSASDAQSGVLRNLAARGRLGGGEEAAARAVAASSAAELARGQSADVARASLQNRMNAIVQGGQAGGNLRMADLTKSRANADIMQNWNQFQSQLFSGQNRDNAMARERANFANADARQGRADANASNAYAAAQNNRGLQNGVAQGQFDNRMGRALGVAGGLRNQATGVDAQQAARNQNLGNLGGAAGRFAGGIMDLPRAPRAALPENHESAGTDAWGR